ncbi:MAG: hypothetical protein IKZ58_02815 [Selenomonadaceae bacterium]|nr:hypothetical protein [Selenomonadaceae bacterium]
MATEEKIKNEEVMSEEELEQVAGGSYSQTEVDKKFFRQLGYDMTSISVRQAYEANGVKFSGQGIGDNEYQIEKPGGWTDHPHWAAMAYVLAQRHYPGFDGKWWEGSAQDFIKFHFNIKNFGN